MEDTSQINLPGNISDFSAAIKELEAEPAKSIKTQKLYKTAGMEILLIALDAQTELKRHTAPGPISVQVIEGSISFRTDELAQDLLVGQLLTLEANVPHSVYSNERSIFLVTKSIPG